MAGSRSLTSVFGLARLRGLGGAHGASGTRGVKPAQALEAVTGVADQIKEADERMAGWIERVGESRAKEAADVRKRGKRGATGYGSATLPELLAEAFLMRMGARYETQMDLGWARPDFIVWPDAGLPLVWRVQGDYWHGAGRPQALLHDAAQRERLMRSTVRGQPVRAVVDVWESDVYKSEHVFVMAMRGEELRPLMGQ